MTALGDPDLKVLDEIEDAEITALNWGLVDGGFSDDEFLDLIDSICERLEDDRSTDEVAQSLERRALVIRVVGPNGQVWRSRMAETVRLLARLRQLFPKHLESGHWRNAPNLVSDYRFVARRRRFPRRNIPSSSFVAEVLPNHQTGHPLRKALQALADGDNATTEYSGFQQRSAQAVLDGIQRGDASATLIAAGTGAGKTKAFYIPALAALATMVDGHNWTKLIAIYPRTELLKDQLQKALDEVRTLRAKTGVALTIGALFSSTPFHISEPPDWNKYGEKQICPFLSCPKCQKDMYWFKNDDVGILKCTSCNEQVGQDELILSRKGQQATPPDILLVTAEMVNRRLGDDYSRHLLGAGQSPERRPRLLLLDEVHTFTGSFGAQVALLLRRWRQAVGQPVHTVALSATIEDGTKLLSDLVGVPRDMVRLVEPLETELELGGNEYLIALRSDPASRTAVLSTTIQAAMLLRRSLDRVASPISEGAFGSKAFVFTDDLDVTNRLLHYLRGAEGQTDKGYPDLRRSPDGSLANLRNSSRPGGQERLLDGQLWKICEKIGHSLDVTQTFSVERTSSQDPGLERKADVVVATASLEVGLDDDTVGAVIQHKAPRDAAAFIQRRGRAGRVQKMRPWTAVVLSDYGRDRQEFQAWDSLFDPLLRPEALPISNRHILRIQATFCLMDWIGNHLRVDGAPKGSTFKDLTSPSRAWGAETRRSSTLEILDRVLDESDLQIDLRNFIAEALDCDQATVEQLLWAPPRGLLSVVVPTARRRLKSGWRRAGQEGRKDIMAKNSPLPDFVPTALFADLLLPEVEISFPDQGGRRRGGENSEDEQLGVLQALREFAPGKVSHRFAIGYTEERLWIDPRPGAIAVEDYFEIEPLSNIADDFGNSVPLLRPITVNPETPERVIGSSSNGRPRWSSRIDAAGFVGEIPIAQNAGLAKMVPSVRAHVHKFGGHLIVHRGTTGSDASIMEGSTSTTISTHFTYGGERVAVGFMVEVDGISFEIADPGGWDGVVERDPSRARSLRSEWFRHRVVSDPNLVVMGSPFLLGWLAEISLALIIDAATETGDLRDGVKALHDPNLPARIVQILDVVFQALSADVEGQEGESADPTSLHAELADLSASGEVKAVLSVLADELITPNGPEFEAWLRDRYAVTLAGAIQTAFTELDPQLASAGLLADIRPWEEGGTTIVISESQPGGIGVIERIAEYLRSDSKRFWRLVESSLNGSEGERVDSVLCSTITAATSEDVAEPLMRLRTADTAAKRSTAWTGTVGALKQHGIELDSSLRRSINLRILRPGSTRVSDTLIHDLLRSWGEAESRIGLEIDVRVFAYLGSGQSEVTGVLASLGGGANQDRRWRFTAVLSMLWNRGSSLRNRHLELWTPYENPVAPERTLVSELLTAPGDDLSRVLPEDFAEVVKGLNERGEVEVVARCGRSGEKAELLELITQPIEVGVLEFFPRVVGVRLDNSQLILTLEMPELI
jgi:hypothetical protein